MLSGDDFYILHGFREILVLAEDQADIILPVGGQSNRIKCYSDVHAFFLRYKKSMRASVRQLDRLISISEWTGKNVNARMAHPGQFVNPEVIPEFIVCRIWNARVEVNL